MLRACLVAFLLTTPILAEIPFPNDQLLVIYGSSGYVLYKAIDFANDHGFSHIKILSYEFTAFDHTISGKCNSSITGGRLFELKDDNSKVSFLCFKTIPDDPNVIEVAKYHSLLDAVTKE